MNYILFGDVFPWTISEISIPKTSGSSKENLPPPDYDIWIAKCKRLLQQGFFSPIEEPANADVARAAPAFAEAGTPAGACSSPSTSSN